MTAGAEKFGYPDPDLNKYFSNFSLEKVFAAICSTKLVQEAKS
jgi:hypothetical protein